MKRSTNNQQHTNLPSVNQRHKSAQYYEMSSYVQSECVSYFNTEKIGTLNKALTYYPTEYEFNSDPIAYINSISKEASNYGICKIVPPKSWTPTPYLDKFKTSFKSRIQQINSLNGTSRMSLNYLKQLSQFHRQHNIPFSRVPQCDRQNVDLFILKKEVDKQGGYLTVCNRKRWACIGRKLGLDSKRCTSLSTALRNLYAKIVLPFEDHIKDYLNKTTQKSTQKTNINIMTCEVCKLGNNDHKMLICDSCNLGMHTYCLNPQIQEIPQCEFFCPRCLLTYDTQFGFDEGPEYTIDKFKKKADEFKKTFEKNNNTEKSQRDYIEGEFWKLVETPFSNFSVEYAADLHSTIHGSVFPTLEKQPLDKYSTHLWNLNNFANVPNCLLSYLESNISGMNVPWIYFGMMFSTFCWHNEDHYTYSINYQHCGDIKTWYGVPGSFSDKFEQFIKDEMPDLFNNNPDLLNQLVTLANPYKAIEKGLEVYTIDQHPNEFIVTFPKAYHAGFNHGFNCNEAINFATMDWLEHGISAIKNYKKTNRTPVFSHDQLVYNVACENSSYHNAEKLCPQLYQIIEKHSRFLHNTKNYKITNMEFNDDLTCVSCNCYCFVNAVQCSKCKKYWCIDHYINKICNCHARKDLTVTLSIERIQQVYNRNLEKIDKYNIWHNSIIEQLKNSNNIHLDVYTQWIKSAQEEKINNSQLYLNLLEHYNRIMETENRINQLLNAKKTKLLEADINNSLEAAEKLAYYSSSTIEINKIHHKLNECKSKMYLAIENCLNITQLNNIYDELNNTGIEILDIEKLKLKILNIDWFIKCNSLLDSTEIEYVSVLQMLDSFYRLNITYSYKEISNLTDLKRNGEKWRDETIKIIKRSYVVHHSYITDIIYQAKNKTPFVSHLLKSLIELENKIQKYKQTITELIASNNRFLYSHVQKIYLDMKAALINFDELTILKNMVIDVTEITEEYKRQLKNYTNLNTIEDILMWINEIIHNIINNRNPNKSICPLCSNKYLGHLHGGLVCQKCSKKEINFDELKLIIISMFTKIIKKNIVPDYLDILAEIMDGIVALDKNSETINLLNSIL